MKSKVITYQDGMLHILRNPDRFQPETVREAQRAAADIIERLDKPSGGMTTESLVEWAASWVPPENRDRFAEAMAMELRRRPTNPQSSKDSPK